MKKHLFQQQCEGLVKTLTKAKETKDNTLYMNAWLNDEHSCGTAACVCGYQALSNNLNLFQQAKGRLYESEDHDTISATISDDLDASCYELFGNCYLAYSIYDGSSAWRLMCAKVADEETPETFKHLTSNEPTLDDAIEYIEFVIEKCKEHQNGTL